MRHNKRRGIISSWSSWRFLWILGLFIVVAAAGMILSQQLLLDNARTMGKIWLPATPTMRAASSKNMTAS